LIPAADLIVETGNPVPDNYSNNRRTGGVTVVVQKVYTLLYVMSDIVNRLIFMNLSLKLGNFNLLCKIIIPGFVICNEVNKL